MPWEMDAPQPLPSLSFGGFRAKGGPVSPGKAYVVGEQGQELFVPQVPGTIVPAFQSNGPMQKRQDVESFDLTRNFGPSRSLVTGDRSLTRNPNERMGAPQLDAMGERIGSRGMTPLRRMEMLARRGDTRANEVLFRGGMGMGGMGGMGGMRAPRFGPPTGFGPAPQPLQTTANNGQPLPTVPDVPLDPLSNLPPPATMEEALGMPGPVPATGAEPMGMMPPRLPFQGQPLPGFNPMGGMLPPSTMMGGAGLPPPPRFSDIPVGGMNMIVDNQTGKQVQGYKPEPQQFTPLSAEELGRIRASGFAPAEVGGRSFDAQGVPYLEPLPAAPVPTERVTEGPAGTTRTYTQPRSVAPAAPPPGSGGGNYFDSLLPAAPTAPTASTQTGQMPNANYAAPLTQEQMLEEARTQYLAGDKGVALQQYFEQFPSAQTLAARQPTPVTPRPLPVVADADKRRVFFTEAELELARLQREALIEQEARRSGFSRLSGRLAQGAEKGFVQMGRDIASNARAVRQLPMDFDRALLPLRQKVGPAVNEFFYGKPGTGPAQKELEDFQRMNRR
jgi:hypothetical protein